MAAIVHSAAALSTLLGSPPVCHIPLVASGDGSGGRPLKDYAEERRDRVFTPMRSPLLTIVTVNRNMREGLARTLASVAAVRHPDLEHLVIDGASDDGSVSLLAQSKNPSLRWASERDGGIYDAMNKGVRQANGRWLLFLNAGDVLADPDGLERLIEAAEGEDEHERRPDIVYGDARILYGDGTSRPRPAENVNAMKRRMPFAHAAALIRRNLLLAQPYETSGQAADYGFFLSCWRQGARFVRVPGTVVEIEAGGVSDRRRVRSTMERWQAVRREGLATPALAGWYCAAVLRAALVPPLCGILPSRLIQLVNGRSRARA